MMNPILSDKKKMSFSKPPHIESVEEIERKFGCLPKVSAVVTGKEVLREVSKVLRCHFPDLYSRSNALTDSRQRKCYKPSEPVPGGIVLFLLKNKSRSGMDNHFREEEFSRNYRKIFKLKCPSMSAVEDFYRKLPPEELDGLKAALIAVLIEKRTLHSHRLSGRYFTVAVDTTGVYASQVRHRDECTFQTSKEFGQLLQQNSGQTIRHLWKTLCAVICTQDPDEFMNQFDSWIAKPRQIRLC
jgi:hypothetical protein